MYSIERAPLLALDLVRHPNGARVVDDLVRALHLTTRDIGRLTAAWRDDAARRAAYGAALATAARDPRLAPLVQTGGGATEATRATEELLPGAPAASAPGVPLAAEVPDRIALPAAPLGGLDDVLVMLRHELSAVPAAARNGVLDAIVATWVETSASGRDVARLRAPWRALDDELPFLPPPAEAGELGQPAALRRIVDRLLRLAAPSAAELHVSFWAGYSGERGWAQPMREAMFAARVAGRLLPIAVVQLSAARAVLLSSLAPADCTSGLMLAVTGAVQGAALADRLRAETYGELTRSWRAVYPGDLTEPA